MWKSAACGRIPAGTTKMAQSRMATIYRVAAFSSMLGASGLRWRLPRPACTVFVANPELGRPAPEGDRGPAGRGGEPRPRTTYHPPVLGKVAMKKCARHAVDAPSVGGQ